MSAERPASSVQAAESTLNAPYGRVVVPCDGVPEHRILEVAVGIARSLSVPLALFSIVSPGMEIKDRIELETIAERLDVESSAFVRTDDGRRIEEQLVALSDEPDVLLCLQARAQSPTLEAIFGSMGEHVIRCSSSSIVVVGPRCDAGFAGRTLIVAVPYGEAHEEWVGAMAHAAARLHLEPRIVTVPEGASAADELILLSSRADVAIIAMATHRKGAIRRLLVGSTAFAVIARARCPILVRNVDTRWNAGS